jgi:hypothetical protein
MRKLNTKCQLENKQLENVHFLSSYFTMSSYLCFHYEEKEEIKSAALHKVKVDFGWKI